MVLRAQLVFLFFACFGSAITLSAQAPQTLRESLKQAVSLFQRGHSSEAAQAFAQLEETFSKEPEYLKIEGTLLPVWGYAAQAAQQHPDAIYAFERFLKKYPEKQRSEKFVLFHLARAYQANADWEKALQTYQRYITADPHSVEAAISALQQAEIYFAQNKTAAGLSHLKAFSESPHYSPSLKQQARLRALQHSQEMKQFETAEKLLLGASWKVTQMPELAILTFAALSVGDAALEAKRYSEAIRAYRLVPPRFQLIQLQEQKLQQLQTRYRQRTEKKQLQSHAAQTWNNHYKAVIERVAGQLKALKESNDYTVHFQLRLGQAMLLDNRPWEAYVLFSHLASDTSLPEALRAQAHYRWVLTAHHLKNEEETVALAHRFADRYPDNPLAPDALFLIAHTYQQQKKYAAVVTLLSDLLARYPEHRSAGRWLFVRGLNHLFAQEYSSARRDFAHYAQHYPQTPLSANAQLWHGLSHFFEKNYLQALDEFDTLLGQTTESHHLYPEICYRRANTLYAMRKTDEALSAVEAFIAQYSNHSLQNEALALQGDILMGQGLLESALQTFAKVAPEAEALFVYATFQQGKIFKALERYDSLITHFTSYSSREDFHPKPRIAEALHWIGWAHLQKGQQSQALPLFFDTLQRYGNDLEASEIHQILATLQSLYRQTKQDSTAALDESPFQGITEFSDWLDAEREKALRQNKLTYYARLSVYLSDHYKKQKHNHLSDAAVLQIIEHVNEEQLDASGLARVGSVLAEMELPASQTYFNKILETFPQSLQRGEAYYGLAQFEVQAEAYDSASNWLEQFQHDIPFHPLNVQATLLQCSIWIHTHRSDETIEPLEQLLRLKSARGEPQAQALLLLGQAWEEQQDEKKAIAYYQRIYTLYRAYPKQVAEAYAASARLFEKRGDITAAYNTLREFLDQPHLRGQPQYLHAKENEARLKEKLPPAAASISTTTQKEGSAL